MSKKRKPLDETAGVAGNSLTPEKHPAVSSSGRGRTDGLPRREQNPAAHLTHKKRGKFGHQPNPMPADDTATDPDYQQTILRLGLAVGDINAKHIDRVEYVTQVASAIRRRRKAFA